MSLAIFVLILLTVILLCSRTALPRRAESASCQHRETSGQNQQQLASTINALGLQTQLPSPAQPRSAHRRSRCRCCGRSRKKSGACRRCNSRRR